jgi:hypothetical protein
MANAPFGKAARTLLSQEFTERDYLLVQARDYWDIDGACLGFGPSALIARRTTTGRKQAAHRKFLR